MGTSSITGGFSIVSMFFFDAGSGAMVEEALPVGSAHEDEDLW